jgi:RsiW-degrading membrane proteinase PrsW (M82 family)
MSTLNIVCALVPVVAFLVQLQLMDSFKLVRPAAVFVAIGIGAVVAVICIPLHEWLIAATGMSVVGFSRYVAPVTEETLKAVFLIALIARRRVGFLVDAAVQGFAVGTGFALVENVVYLRALPDAPLLLWLVRGLGTAVLHGATTAMFAMISRTLADRHPDRLWAVFWPGWLVAVAVHSAFNHVPLSPIAMTILLLVVLPALVLVVYHRSEASTRDWIGAGLDLDVELLHLVRSEAFAFTRFGIYLRELRQRFPGPVVADMFCLLRLELELSVQAKAMLLAREAGVQVPVDDDLTACLAEIEYLNASIGRTGVLALKPLMVSSHRDRWHRHLLAQAGSQTRLSNATRTRRLRAALRDGGSTENTRRP